MLSIFPTDINSYDTPISIVEALRNTKSWRLIETVLQRSYFAIIAKNIPYIPYLLEEGYSLQTLISIIDTNPHSTEEEIIHGLVELQELYHITLPPWCSGFKIRDLLLFLDLNPAQTGILENIFQRLKWHKNIPQTNTLLSILSIRTDMDINWMQKILNWPLDEEPLSDIFEILEINPDFDFSQISDSDELKSWIEKEELASVTRNMRHYHLLGKGKDKRVYTKPDWQPSRFVRKLCSIQSMEWEIRDYHTLFEFFKNHYPNLLSIIPSSPPKGYPVKGKDNLWILIDHKAPWSPITEDIIMTSKQQDNILQTLQELEWAMLVFRDQYPGMVIDIYWGLDIQNNSPTLKNIFIDPRTWKISLVDYGIPRDHPNQPELYDTFQKLALWKLIADIKYKLYCRSL